MSLLEAIELPDAEPDREANRRRAYTPEEAIALAKVWERETGAPPVRDAWDVNKRRKRLRKLYDRCKHWEGEVERYLTGGYPSTVTVLKLFGSWNAFIAACGWEPREAARPRIAAAMEPPATPTSNQIRRGAGLHLDERRRRELLERARNGPVGPSVLKERIRSVAAAQKDGDREWLAGELDSLAAAALAWADKLRSTSTEPPYDPSIERVPVAPLCEAFERSSMTASELARELGWMERGNGDSSRMKRTLGLAPHVHSDGRETYRTHIDGDTAERIADALGIPLDDLMPHEDAGA